MTLGEKIKELRSRDGITQKDLADKLSVTAQAVSRWEKDEVEPSVSTLKQMASIFNVTVDELLGQDTPPKVVEKEVVVEKPVIVEKPLVVEKPVVVEKQVVVEKPVEKEPQPQMLALCSQCNKPIYDPNDILRLHHSGTKGKSGYDYIICRKCAKENEEKEKQKNVEVNTSRFHKSLGFGITFGVLMAVLFIVVAIFSKHPYFYGVAAGASILAYTFTSCMFLGNNVVGGVFLSICMKTIHLPGIIFTLDADGLKALIVFKLLGAIIVFLFGILMLLLGFAVASVVSLFVYPFAVSKNVNYREEKQVIL